MDRFLKFKEVNVVDEGKEDTDGWKILIVDDEEDVHRITRIVTKNLTFEGKPIRLLSAYSKQEAIEVLRRHPDIALAIIDVVMEDRHAGLDLVRYIREVLKNRKTRLVIRTGQPGYAPQKEVVLEYDINDYREKTELSSERLITMILSGLRSYRDIVYLEKEAEALKGIVEFTLSITHSENEEEFLKRALTTLRGIGEKYGIAPEIEVMGVTHVEDLEVDISKLKESFVWWRDGNKVYLFLAGEDGIERVVVATFPREVKGTAKDVLDIFLHNFVNARDKLKMSVELHETLNEVILTLSEVLETRSEETGEHVYRVSSVVYEMAKALGLSEQEAFEWKVAAMVHDIGKVGIPDSILNKPARLTPEEFEVIKQHTVIGYRILSRSKRKIFKIAASIALNHHENWDGTGYPNGLKGEEIPLEARVTAIADVYDALSSDRVYRRAWPKEKVFEYIKENSGRKFDPELVPLFFEVVS